MIEPGPVGTDFVGNAQAMSQKAVASSASADEETKAMMQAVMTSMMANKDKVQTGDEVAEVIREALLAEKPHFRYQTNKAYAQATRVKLADPTGDTSVDFMYQRFFSWIRAAPDIKWCRCFEVELK